LLPLSRNPWFRIAVFMAATPLSLAAAPSHDGGNELVVGSNGVVNATVNGHAARLLLSGDGSSAPVFNPEAAARLGLKAGWVGVAVKVGPVTVNGRTAVARLSVGDAPFKRRVAWFERSIAPGLDGMIGPSSLKQPVVTFVIHPAVSGEREFTVPLIDKGYQGLGTVTAEHATMLVQFDVGRATSLATAAAANDIALRHGGAFVGVMQQATMRLGVDRPVRAMELARPFVLGPLRLNRLDVRTSDYGSTSAIPDKAADPDEIVVTAKGKPGRAVRTLHIGLDALRHCSRIMFDKPRKQIRLSCRPT
jgi:hypothetical protein